ncbi:MAG: hypothetical protein JXQ67_05160 [Campylobacterales bacterium]|nr:hypothetical protein [Campylobacterales bacterium]
MSEIKLNRTAPIVREASMVYSWYLGSYELNTYDNGSAMYEAIRINDLGEMLLIAGVRPLDVSDGIIIDYLVSEWKQFTTYEGFDGEVEISLSKLLGLIKEADNRYNRSKLKEQLVSLEFTRIQVSKPSVEDWYFRIFSDGLRFDEQTDKFKYRISKSFVEQMQGRGTRYISIEHLPTFKSIYTKELYRYLQVIGQGGKTQDNHLGMKLNVSIKDAIQFLNLEERIKSNKSRSATLSKAFKEINDVIGTDYKCIRSANAYVRTNRSKTKVVDNTVDIFDVDIKDEWFDEEVSTTKAEEFVPEVTKEEAHIIDGMEELPLMESTRDEAELENKLDAYLGLNGRYYAIITDNEVMELPSDVDKSKYNIIENPYLKATIDF